MTQMGSDIVGELSIVNRQLSIAKEDEHVEQVDLGCLTSVGRGGCSRCSCFYIFHSTGAAALFGCPINWVI
jgi:hypothetical protein